MRASSSLIRQDSDYGIRALLHLATAADQTATAAEVAAARHIPKSFLYKVMKKMQKAELIASRAGRKGGFQLKVAPKQITLNAIVTAIQGPLTLRTCLVDPKACWLSRNCRVSANLRRLQGQIVKCLDDTTLADLSKSFRSSRG